MPKTSRNPIGRALDVLRFMVERPMEHIGVRGLAEALSIAPSSAHRLLNALVDAGFLVQDGRHGNYAIGVEMLRLAHLTTERVPLQRIAISQLEELVKCTNETAFLGVYDRRRRQMMITATVESAQRLRYVSELRTWMPIHAGASGLGIMAFLPEEEKKQIIAKTELERLTEKTITEPRQLLDELERIRRRGYAITSGQRTRGAVAISAPIFGPSNEVLGDVVLTLPEHRFDPEREGSLARLVRDCANNISTQVGSSRLHPFTHATNRNAKPRSAESISPATQNSRPAARLKRSVKRTMR